MSSASIHSIVGDEAVRAESAAWSRFTSTRNAQDFAQGWLAILCAQIDRVGGALLLMGGGRDANLAAAAVWPDPQRDMQYLAPAAERALRERRGVVAAADGGAPSPAATAIHIAYPIEVEGALRGAVVLDIASRPDADLQRALRLVHWASAWLLDHFRRELLAASEARTRALALAADSVATALTERRTAAAALALANELAGRMGCERVSVGLEKSGSVEVVAVSHNASFDRKANLVRLISEAMDEVLDLDVALMWPPAGTDSARHGAGGQGAQVGAGAPPEPGPADELGALAHAELAREQKDSAIVSVPLESDGHAIGAICFERGTGGTPFSPDEVDLAKTIGLLVGPVLELKRDAEKPLWRRARERFDDGTRALFGPRHPGLKLAVSLGVLLVVFLALANGDYRVASKTVIEGEVQRAVVAPFDGYIAETRARAGDTVKKGQLLASLDRRDLLLEAERGRSELEQLSRQHRQAFAAQDRGATVVLAAQMAQAQAQLSLTEEKLARATLAAPYDGVVVSGDLSQLLGTPVEVGKVLFEIAPLEAYRVILQVDERDIASVAVGNSGELALAGIPGETMRFRVARVTPVTTQADGRNYFRVEARVDNPSNRLRPGMEGVGKIDAGERRLLWIWTHSLVDWLRLWFWKWMP